jgi:hypothetical protein
MITDLVGFMKHLQGVYSPPLGKWIIRENADTDLPEEVVARFIPIPDYPRLDKVVDFYQDDDGDYFTHITSDGCVDIVKAVPQCVGQTSFL